MTKLLVVYIGLLATVVLSGCQNTFYKSVDGISNSVALSIPSEDTVKIQVLEYLSGQKTVVRDRAKIRHEFTTVNSNDYFSCIHIRERRQSVIEIEPVEEHESTNELSVAESEQK